MSPDGEFVRNQPWRNAYGAWAPYGHFNSPQGGFYAASFGPPHQFPAAYSSGLEGGPPPQTSIPDGVFAPQLSPYAYQTSLYPMEGPAPLWGAYPDLPIRGHQWHVQPGIPTSPWACFGPYPELDRLDGGHNPAVDWNSTCVWNTQPGHQQQQQQQQQQQHEQQEQSTRRPQQDARARRPAAHVNHIRRHSHLRSSTPESTTSCPNRSSTPKPKQSQSESRSPFRDILRSASKLSRSLLSTPWRTASRLSRSASRRRNRNSDEDESGEEKEEEEDGACWSDDDVDSPVKENLDNRSTTAGGSMSRGWGSLRRRSGLGDRRGESPSPKVKGKRAEHGMWQQEYQRTSARQDGAGKGRPRPQSYPAVNYRRVAVRPGDGHRHYDRAREGGSHMSNLEENRRVSRMNGLLDIWDAQDNPSWEEEAFALCDLSRCSRCGRFYAPMKTMRHRCRN